MERADDNSPAGAAPDWTIPQDWESYTAEEHAVWDHLFERQSSLLNGRAVPEFIDGLETLRLSRKGIPDFDELNQRLASATGWQVVAVPGLVPDRLFFEHLANRRFVAGRFIRSARQIDYLQAYGEGGLRADGLHAIDRLARLYWYTVEFGLIRQQGELRLYGAGIVSSHAESRFALDDPSPHRIRFDLMRVMRTRYRIDDFQQSYFVIDSFEDLLRQTLETDFEPLYEELVGLEDIDPGTCTDQDELLNRGTQAYARARTRH